MTPSLFNSWRSTLLLIIVANLWFLSTLGTMHFFHHHNAARALPQLEASLQRLKEDLPEHNANPAYTENLRALDLVYRQAYFTTTVQTARAEKLLGVGVLIMLAAATMLIFLHRYRPKMPPVAPDLTIYTFQDRVSLAVPWLTAGTALAVTLMLLLGGRHTNRSQLPKTSTEKEENRYTTPAEQLAQWHQFRPAKTPEYPFSHTQPLQIAWKVDLSLPGFSSPIVWNERIFLSGGDRNNTAILAYSSVDGRELWRLQPPATGEPPPDVSNDTGYAAASPVTDGYRVAAIFATGQLICADADGNRLWYRKLPQPQILYGYANSLLLHGHRLIVQIDTETQHSLLAIDIANGKTLWENNRPEHTASAWSSPIVAKQSDGTELVITLSNDFMEAFRLEDGQTAWKQECMSGEIASSPVFRAGRILLAHSGLAARAFSPDDGSEIWSNDSVLLPDVASPGADDQTLYLAESSGTVSALNLQNGKLIWEKENNHGFYASPTVFADGTLLLIDLTGKILLWKTTADTPPEEIQQLELASSVFATPAITTDAIIIRSEKKLLKLAVPR